VLARIESTQRKRNQKNVVKKSKTKEKSCEDILWSWDCKGNCVWGDDDSCYDPGKELSASEIFSKKSETKIKSCEDILWSWDCKGNCVWDDDTCYDPNKKVSALKKFTKKTETEIKSCEDILWSWDCNGNCIWDGDTCREPSKNNNVFIEIKALNKKNTSVELGVEIVQNEQFYPIYKVALKELIRIRTIEYRQRYGIYNNTEIRNTTTRILFKRRRHLNFHMGGRSLLVSRRQREGVGKIKKWFKKAGNAIQKGANAVAKGAKKSCKCNEKSCKCNEKRFSENGKGVKKIWKMGCKGIKKIWKTCTWPP
jgi:hypothetical protein